jgi:hypothetical protein
MEPVGEHVVDERAFGRHQRGILGLIVGQLRRVVRRDRLNRRQRVLAGDLDLPHMADVEDAGPGSDRQVLVDDAGVFDWHVPAAELDHPSAKRTVLRVQGRFLERAGRRLGHRVDQRSAGASCRPPAGPALNQGSRTAALCEHVRVRHNHSTVLCRSQTGQERGNMSRSRTVVSRERRFTRGLSWICRDLDASRTLLCCPRFRA